MEHTIMIALLYVVAFFLILIEADEQRRGIGQVLINVTVAFVLITLFGA